MTGIEFFSILFTYTVLSLLLDIFLLREKKKYLYIIIPIQIFLSIYGYMALDQVRGHAIHSVAELETANGFQFISYFVYNHEVYLIAIAPKKTKPRFYLYISTEDQASGKMKNLQQILEKLAQAQKMRSEGMTVYIKPNGISDKKKGDGQSEGKPGNNTNNKGGGGGDNEDFLNDGSAFHIFKDIPTTPKPPEKLDATNG